jgi:hypothetical protein
LGERRNRIPQTDAGAERHQNSRDVDPLQLHGVFPLMSSKWSMGRIIGEKRPFPRTPRLDIPKGCMMDYVELGIARLLRPAEPR